VFLRLNASLYFPGAKFPDVSRQNGSEDREGDCFGLRPILSGLEGAGSVPPTIVGIIGVVTIVVAAFGGCSGSTGTETHGLRQGGIRSTGVIVTPHSGFGFCRSTFAPSAPPPPTGALGLRFFAFEG
jgi:hypothetical protein